MSIEKHFERQGIKLTEDNTLPPGERTCRMFKRVIAAVRAAEAESNDELRSEARLRATAQEQVIALQHEVQQLRAELAQARLAKRLESIESLSTAERKLLLEGPANEGDGDKKVA